MNGSWIYYLLNFLMERLIVLLGPATQFISTLSDPIIHYLFPFLFFPLLAFFYWTLISQLATPTVTVYDSMSLNSNFISYHKKRATPL